MFSDLKQWFGSGKPWVWLNAGAVSISIVMVAALLILIGIRGLGHFWAKPIMEADYLEPDGSISRLVGEIHEREVVPREQIQDPTLELPEGTDTVARLLVKTGNRDTVGLDFRWALEARLQQMRYPEKLMAIERYEWGNFYGYLKEVRQDGTLVASGDEAWQALQPLIERAGELRAQIKKIEQDDIGAINYQIEKLRLAERRLELDGVAAGSREHQAIAEERQVLQNRYQGYQARLRELYQQIGRDSLTGVVMDGQEVDMPLSVVVRAYRPNEMGLFDKIGFYIAKLWEFVSDDPREANTEGGIFPAIFGTVMMVILMSIFVTPFGVIAAVYLREYARQGPLTRVIRIAVNNLAGVPSIVYGVFGLGFFVYFLGGNIDQLFFPEALPAPTYGTGGLFWASLTLAILTLPVVIVATEEGLSRIPSSIREGSLALGATKAETLWRTVLPMSSPAMMTGLILAVARAAGEVAPLMLVGVVKLAPSLPLDSNAPFLHLDRKFMHLGFHIYDVGFQSPNVEAARPLVYATALLLVLVIVMLNLAAIAIRNHLREKYRALEQ
ncbi:MAG: phosphate ABC transporter permease PstA [Gammaproteobacteria bacterium]|nr:phosphate ABC transporter permease PstA [Gammaproteobacteria bacterium]MCW8958081.1 phosphate ABC transporter permease PstA [Gammaproteobacteria bacterium]MCW8971689.1 phosphate ABC transporter permease PstA [Gammaproteobacteria bacterium]MCW8993406.1 phosphate ABC transporter permease PstA [Gammaproteobacteria bacterium]MCW9088885.1 phosphate ABC transporter permease PstA [Gammaproteobacteria bacterium]